MDRRRELMRQTAQWMGAMPVDARGNPLLMPEELRPEPQEVIQMWPAVRDPIVSNRRCLEDGSLRPLD